jgi:hypothetical protein
MKIIRFVFKKGTSVSRQEEVMAQVRGWSDVVALDRLVPGVDENAPTFRIVCVRMDLPADDKRVSEELRQLPEIEYVG